MRAWARLAAEAGMRYAVLTAKHVDGFCLWPSRARRRTRWRRRRARRDLVARVRRGLSRRGAARSASTTRSSIATARSSRTTRATPSTCASRWSELLGYGEMVELWFDGAWDKDHPTRDWPHDPSWPPSTGARWEWARPVPAHPSPAAALPGRAELELRSAGRAQLPARRRAHERALRLRVARAAVRAAPRSAVSDGERADLPAARVRTTLTPGWFWQANACYAHASAETIAGWRRRAEGQGANLLLNVGPDTSGRMPDYHRGFLLEAERLVRR